MLMESGKIYQRKYYINYLMCPSIQTTEDTKLYISNKGQKPSSINEMVEIDIKQNGINSIVGSSRWIAVTYSEGEVYEMGLIETPFDASRDEMVVILPEEVTIDGKHKLYLNNSQTSLIWE